RAGAHLHGLGRRVVDIGLKKWPRPRQQIDLAAGKLDGQIALCLARRQFLVIVRAHGPEDQGEERAQDAILVEAADRVERMIDRLNLGYGCERGSGTLGIETRLEQLNEPAGDLRLTA